MLTLIAASAGRSRQLAIGQVPWLLGVDDQDAIFNRYGWKAGLEKTADEVVLEDVVAALAGDRAPVVDRDVFALVVRLSQRLRELAQAQPSTATYLRCAFAGSWPVAAECLQRVNAIIDEQLRASPGTRDELTSARVLPLAQLVLAPALLTQPAGSGGSRSRPAPSDAEAGGVADRPGVLELQEVEWRVVAIRHNGRYTDASSVSAWLFVDGDGQLESSLGGGRFVVRPGRLELQRTYFQLPEFPGLKGLVHLVALRVLSSSPAWVVKDELATLEDEQTRSALVLQRRVARPGVGRPR